MNKDWRHVTAVQQPDGWEIMTWMTRFPITDKDKQALGLVGENFKGLTQQQAQKQGDKLEAAIAKTRRKK